MKIENKMEIEKILSNWDLGKLISYKRAKKGVVNVNFIMKTTKGKFVLRKTAWFKKENQLKFELEYLDYLNNNGFSYKIPAPIKTKSGKLFIKIDKSNFWIYRYLDGDIIKEYNKPELKQVAKMMSEFHNIIEKSGLDNKTNPEPFSEEIITFKNEILKQKKQDKKQKIFIKEAEILLPLYYKLQNPEYKKLKKYPLHRDINPQNTIWKNGKLIGVIDFENSSETQYPIIKDIACVLQYSCMDKKDKFKINLRLASFFIKEYKKHKNLSDKEILFIPEIIALGFIEDFTYVYWMLLNDKKRAKLSRLKLYSKAAQWHYNNRDKITKELLL